MMLIFKALLLVFLAVTVVYIAYDEIQGGNDWGSYERGAWAVVQHHKAFGNYGSIAYRKAAFKWGDPQSKEDVEKILEIVKREYPE